MVYINDIYLVYLEVNMEIAKVFQTGRSQAVRLPKAFRLMALKWPSKASDVVFC
jgi:hypothetical protein